MPADVSVPSEQPSLSAAEQPLTKAFSWRTVLWPVLVSLLVSCASLSAYDTFWARQVVAVDLQGFLAEQRELFIAGKIDDEELQRRMDSLERLVDGIPRRHAVILGEVAVRNIEVLAP
jgi:hypothetical protein